MGMGSMRLSAYNAIKIPIASRYLVKLNLTASSIAFKWSLANLGEWHPLHVLTHASRVALYR